MMPSRTQQTEQAVPHASRAQASLTLIFDAPDFVEAQKPKSVLDFKAFGMTTKIQASAKNRKANQPAAHQALPGLDGLGDEDLDSAFAEESPE